MSNYQGGELTGLPVELDGDFALETDEGGPMPAPQL